eukprot:362644-Chlamydomonas_euryale.AAC.1
MSSTQTMSTTTMGAWSCTRRVGKPEAVSSRPSASAIGRSSSTGRLQSARTPACTAPKVGNREGGGTGKRDDGSGCESEEAAGGTGCGGGAGRLQLKGSNRQRQLLKQHLSTLNGHLQPSFFPQS